MELKQLEAFVRVVEEQSFSGAARALYLTQPTVSVHIAALEGELNVKLLERTTKRVVPTKDGERLYEYAREILAVREEIYQEFGEALQKEVKIEIAASTIPSQHMLPEIMPEFQKTYKNVQFSLLQGDSAFAIEEIKKNRADIGFVGMKLPEKSLCFLPFYEDRLVIILPNEKHYQKLLEDENPIERILKEPIILREEGSGTKKTAESFFKEKGIRREELNVVALMNDQEMIKKSVSKGMGVSLISKKSVLDYVKMGRLLMYEPEGEPIRRPLYLVFGQKKRFGRVEKEFIEFCRRYYEE